MSHNRQATPLGLLHDPSPILYRQILFDLDSAGSQLYQLVYLLRDFFQGLQTVDFHGLESIGPIQLDSRVVHARTIGIRCIGQLGMFDDESIRIIPALCPAGRRIHDRGDSVAQRGFEHPRPKVNMGIDQAGHHGVRSRLDLLLRIRQFFVRVGGNDPGNSSVGYNQPLDRPHVRLVRSHVQQLASANDQVRIRFHANRTRATHCP